MKLVVAEAESAALGAALSGVRLVSSELTVTELRRAVLRRPPAPLGLADLVLQTLVLLPVDRAVLDRAATLLPVALRSLDAVHLATALSLGSAVDDVLTYDHRMAEAARTAGLAVASPGAAL